MQIKTNTFILSLVLSSGVLFALGNPCGGSNTTSNQDQTNASKSSKFKKNKSNDPKNKPSDPNYEKHSRHGSLSNLATCVSPQSEDNPQQCAGEANNQTAPVACGEYESQYALPTSGKAASIAPNQDSPKCRGTSYKKPTLNRRSKSSKSSKANCMEASNEDTSYHKGYDTAYDSGYETEQEPENSDKEWRLRDDIEQRYLQECQLHNPDGELDEKKLLEKVMKANPLFEKNLKGNIRFIAIVDCSVPFSKDCQAQIAYLAAGGGYYLDSRPVLVTWQDRTRVNKSFYVCKDSRQE